MINKRYARGTPRSDRVGHPKFSKFVNNHKSGYQLLLPFIYLVTSHSTRIAASQQVMSAPVTGAMRSGSAPPAAAVPTDTPKSPPASNPHLPLNPSPLSPNARRLSTETQPRSSVKSALQQVSSQLQNATTSSTRKGKGRVLGIQERLRKEVDGVVKRRQGGVLARG